jgi:hypothetical protein
LVLIPLLTFVRRIAAEESGEKPYSLAVFCQLAAGVKYPASLGNGFSSYCGRPGGPRRGLRRHWLEQTEKNREESVLRNRCLDRGAARRRAFSCGLGFSTFLPGKSSR